MVGTGCPKKCTTFVSLIVSIRFCATCSNIHQKIARSMEIYWHPHQTLSPVRSAHDVTCSKCLPFWATHSAARRLAFSVTRVHVAGRIRQMAARIAWFKIPRVSGALWYTTLFKYPPKKKSRGVRSSGPSPSLKVNHRRHRGLMQPPSGFPIIIRERIGRSSRNLVSLTFEQFNIFP